MGFHISGRLALPIGALALGGIVACMDVIEPLDEPEGGTDPGSEVVDVWDGDSEMNGAANPLGTATYSDPQVCGVIEAANKGAVAVSQLAGMRAGSAAVRALASHIAMERTVAVSRDTALFKQLAIVPAASGTSLELAKETDTATSSLQSLAGAAFDAAYLSSQITAHAQILGLLDYSLVPSAKNATLRAELENMREMVASQLGAILKLQQPPTKAPDAGTPPPPPPPEAGVRIEAGAPG